MKRPVIAFLNADQTMCSSSPAPFLALPIFLALFLLFVSPLFANPPFNRFPNSPSGIYRLGTHTLGDYQKKLRLLTDHVDALEEKGTSKERELERTEVLKKNGFNDEAQLKYLHHVVKWEMKKRKSKH